jgi:hypothetical protein
MDSLSKKAKSRSSSIEESVSKAQASTSKEECANCMHLITRSFMANPIVKSKIEGMLEAFLSKSNGVNSPNDLSDNNDSKFASSNTLAIASDKNEIIVEKWKNTVFKGMRY